MKNYTIFGAMMETKKNKVGRPPKFKTAEELQAAIDDYFEKGVTVKEVIVDKKVVNVKVPTITGLALYIVPASMFNHEDEDEEQFKTCWALENLQPLEAKLNLIKGDRLID